MSLVVTQGIKVTASFPAHNTNASVHVTPFNDLDAVGASPTGLNIRGIKQIVLYGGESWSGPTDEDVVVGIKTVYKLNRPQDQDSPQILHGRETSSEKKINVEDDERIIAAFVGTDKNDRKNIRVLHFGITNQKTGANRIEGYVPSPPGGLAYSAAFGEIVAFQGIKLRGNPGQIISIGFETRLTGSA